MRTSRLLVGIPVAAAITFGLFVVMDRLVDNNESHTVEETPKITISFLRTVKDEPPLPDGRLKRPEPQEVLNTPKPKPETGKKSSGDGIQVSLDVSPEFDPTNLDTSSANADEIPIVRVGPIYPERAASRGTEGWVVVQFDVKANGQVDPDSVVVIDAEPKNVFDKSAINAVKKWKYKAKKVNGQYVRRNGLQVQLTYELDS